MLGPFSSIWGSLTMPVCPRTYAQDTWDCVHSGTPVTETLTHTCSAIMMLTSGQLSDECPTVHMCSSVPCDITYSFLWSLYLLSISCEFELTMFGKSIFWGLLCTAWYITSEGQHCKSDHWVKVVTLGSLHYQGKKFSR